MNPMIEEDELSGPELARRLGVQKTTVNKWRYEGCPCVAYNPKMLRYKLSDVRLWLRERAAKREALTKP